MAISKSEPQIAQVPQTPIPRRLGRYEVIDRLAVGGMAEIFVCWERGLAGLERLVVVKRILPHLAAHQVFVEMFLAEARYVARLNHPNVVGIIELAQDDDGAPFLAMEYVAGSSVRDLLVTAIEKESPTSIGAAIGIIAQACAGAHAAHELVDPHGQPLGLVHRDISPHNLMVTSEGHTKLLDFGIAKATQAAELDDHTRTGALKGKVHYMSPEQCKQLPLDRRSDVFALGIVVWEMLAQERLFKRESDLDSMHAIVTGDKKDLRKIRPDVPLEIVAAIEKSIEPKKENRYATADDMRKALLDACEKKRIACGVDDVAAFVRPLLGDAQKKRQAELLQQAQDKTQATPASQSSSAALMSEDATLADKKSARAGEIAKRPKTLTGTRSKTGAKAGSPSTAPAPVDEGKRSGRLAASIVVTAVLAIVVALAFVFKDRFLAPSGTPLIVGFPPTADAQLMLGDTEAMREWLEHVLERPVEVRIAKSYDDLQDRLLRQELDLAALPPYLYVETKSKDPRVDLVATKLVEGSSGNDSILYVNEASGITSIAELKGKRFCFPDYKSTTGYLFPRLALKRAGVDPDKDIVSHLSGSHMQALRDLVAGVCDAAATYSAGYLAADRAGVAVARAHQLAIIGRSPHDAMTVRAGLPAADRRRVKEALLSFKPADGGKSGKVERISGFQEAKNKDYDAVRDALAAAK